MAAGKVWSLSRFNDGEWFAILGTENKTFHGYRNCDGHDYLPGLCADLIRCLKDPGDYYYGRGGRKWMSNQDAWMTQHGVSVDWVYSDAIKKMNNEGRLKPFLDQLRRRRVVHVGPASHAALGAVLRIPQFHHVEIPSKNCWTALEATVHRVSDYLVNRADPGVVTFSASMATNPMIHQLHKLWGDWNWLIDVGAMFDIYLGIESRSVFRDQDWSERIARNLA